MGRAKPYWNIPAKTFDDPGTRADWARFACEAARRSKRSKPKKQTNKSAGLTRQTGAFVILLTRSHAGWNQHEGRNIVSKTNRSRTVIIAITAALVLFGLRLAAAFFI